jgi:hypothetical protein
VRRRLTSSQRIPLRTSVASLLVGSILTEWGRRLESQAGAALPHLSFRSAHFFQVLSVLSISLSSVRFTKEQGDIREKRRKGEIKMRFMILRKADRETEAGVLPTQELLAAMGKYMEEMGQAGVLLAGEGLHPSSKGARIKFSGGKPTVIDGPFAETRELIGGFCIIQVKSKAEAIDWIKRWPSVDGHGELELEIRQLLEAEDFGPEFTPELRKQEERIREQIGAKK